MIPWLPWLRNYRTREVFMSSIIPVFLKEFFVLLFLQCVQLVNILVLESVLMRSVLCCNQGLLNQRLGVFWLLWNDAMLSENIIPVLCAHTLVQTSWTGRSPRAGERRSKCDWTIPFSILVLVDFDLHNGDWRISKPPLVSN